MWHKNGRCATAYKATTIAPSPSTTPGTTRTRKRIRLVTRRRTPFWNAVHALRQACEPLDDHPPQHPKSGTSEPKTKTVEGIMIWKTPPQYQWRQQHPLRSTLHYTALGQNQPYSELWHLVKALICVLPTYDKYVNPMTSQLQIVQQICYEGSCGQYRYKLDERYWEDVILAPV